MYHTIFSVNVMIRGSCGPYNREDSGIAMIHKVYHCISLICAVSASITHAINDRGRVYISNRSCIPPHMRMYDASESHSSPLNRGGIPPFSCLATALTCSLQAGRDRRRGRERASNDVLRECIDGSCAHVYAVCMRVYLLYPCVLPTMNNTSTHEI